MAAAGTPPGMLVRSAAHKGQVCHDTHPGMGRNSNARTSVTTSPLALCLPTAVGHGTLHRAGAARSAEGARSLLLVPCASMLTDTQSIQPALVQDACRTPSPATCGAEKHCPSTWSRDAGARAEARGPNDTAGAPASGLCTDATHAAPE